MGSFEKLVVATVFFLSAVVLAVTLSTRDPAADGAGTAAVDGTSEGGIPAREVGPTTGPGALAQGPATPALGSQSAGASGTAGPSAPDRGRAPLLSTSIGVPAPIPAPVSTPARTEVTDPAPAAAQNPIATGVLVLREGLDRSPLEGRWLYTWSEGDTWTRVAQRLYGSGAFAEDLRVVNDDARPTAGTRVFVLERMGSTARADAADPRLPRPAPIARPQPAVGGDVVVNAEGTFVEHVVGNGDTLSSISERYYGTAARWRRIYDANRDELPNPDRLKVGTHLRIP